MVQRSTLQQIKPIEFDNLAETVRVCIVDTQGHVQVASPDFFDGLFAASNAAANYRLEMRCSDDGLVSVFDDVAEFISCGDKWVGWCRIADTTPPSPWLLIFTEK